MANSAVVTQNIIRAGLRIVQILWNAESANPTINLVDTNGNAVLLGGNSIQIAKVVTSPGTPIAADAFTIQLLDRFNKDVLGGKLALGDTDASEIQGWLAYDGDDARANPAMLYPADDYRLVLGVTGATGVSPNNVGGYIEMFLTG